MRMQSGSESREKSSVTSKRPCRMKGEICEDGNRLEIAFPLLQPGDFRGIYIKSENEKTLFAKPQNQGETDIPQSDDSNLCLLFEQSFESIDRSIILFSLSAQRFPRSI